MNCFNLGKKLKWLIKKFRSIRMIGTFLKRRQKGESQPTIKNKGILRPTQNSMVRYQKTCKT